VLDEILAGNCSDPPGFEFYHQKLDRHGAPASNELGLPLLDCCRGTNLTECVHKQIMATFGSWVTGVEMGDALLAWFRHCYNQHVSERRRLGFPVIGHPWTWLIDKIQELVRKNHNVDAYKGWSNESDYERTKESFGTLPLHSKALGDAVEAIDKTQLAGMDLTRGEKYIAERMGVKAPFLPVHSKAERQLFARLVAECKDSTLDFDKMAIEWCRSVDGKTIFPKLPVYLRTYHTAWQKNNAARDAAREAAAGAKVLTRINKITQRKPRQEEPGEGGPPAGSIVAQ